MADQNYYDGSFPFATEDITIGAVTYAADGWDEAEDALVTEVRGSLNQPLGQVVGDGFKSGTVALQMNADETIPAVKGTFTRGGYTYIITGVGAAEVKDGIKTLRISHRRKIN